MFSILFLACAQQPADTDAATDTSTPETIRGENYMCADGGQVTHAHAFDLDVAPGDDIELSTVYDDDYRDYHLDAYGYEAPKMTLSGAVDLDEDGRAFVICEWLSTEDYEGRVEASYTLVVRG